MSIENDYSNQDETEEYLSSLKLAGELLISTYGWAREDILTRGYLCSSLQSRDIGNNLKMYSDAVNMEFRNSLEATVKGISLSPFESKREQPNLVLVIIEHDFIKQSYLDHILESFDRLALQFNATKINLDE